MDVEELRIALAMNGGVSLAVWMGGVTLEVGRLVASDGVYGELSKILSSRARVDVISGTSAGGINGAFFALAVAQHGRSRDLVRQLETLRGLWVSKASFSQLLRDPYKSKSRSLLDGDGYFLRTLQETFASLVKVDGPPTPPGDVPIELTLTTTLLKGRQRRAYADDFGGAISDVDHKGQFRFSRGPRLARDAFDDPRIAERLALAARCTASFPGAFEASLCPVERPGLESLGNRPNMEGFTDFDSTAYVVDGGVLDNKPIAAAIDQIFRQRASGPVRRVLAYVVPDPETAGKQEALTDASGNPLPDLVPVPLQVVLSSLVEIPRVQSISAQLDALREHNRRVRERRHSRILLTSNVGAAEIDELSRSLFAAYRQRRIEGGLDYVVASLAEGALSLSDGRGLRHRGRREWLYRQVFSHRDALQWVPTTHPLDAAPDFDFGDPAGWRWGVRPVEHFGRLLIDLVGRAQRLASRLPSDHSLSNAWDEAYEILESVGAYRSDEGGYWKAQASSEGAAFLRADEFDSPDAQEGASAWFAASLAEWNAKLVAFEVSRLAERAARALLDMAPVVHAISEQAAALQDDLFAAEEVALSRLYGYFVRTHTDGCRHVLERLLAFEVVQDALGGPSTPVAEQEIEFIQVSAAGRAYLGGASDPAAKLNGIQIAHFGAFYKSSWRANDWMWGRLDAVRRLVPLLLDPERLRAVSLREPQGGRAATYAGHIERIALGDASHPCRKELQEAFDLGAVRRELAYLDDPRLLVPERLAASVAAIARRLEFEILGKELRLLASNIAVDRAEGARVGEATEIFYRDYEALKRADGSLDGAAIQSLIQGCLIGEERLEREVGTDRLAATAAQSLAVGLSAVQEQEGLSQALGIPLRAIRGAAVLLFLYTRNAATPSQTMNSIASLFAGAGFVIVLSAILGLKAFPEWAVIAGCAALSAGLLMILSRTNPLARSILAGLACIGIAVLLIALAASSDFRTHLGLSSDAWRALALFEGGTLFLLYLGSGPSWMIRLRHGWQVLKKQSPRSASSWLASRLKSLWPRSKA